METHLELRDRCWSVILLYIYIHEESSVEKGNKEKIASKEVDKDEGYPSNSISTTEAKNRGTEFVIGLLRINVFTGFVE